MDSNIFNLIYKLDSFKCKNIVLIDNSIQDSQMFFSSVNIDTFPIIYSYSSTKTELLKLLRFNFRTINRIAIAFTTNLNSIPFFLDNKTFFNKTNSYNDNVNFIIDLIKEFSIKNIDFLGCNTLKFPMWINYYKILTKDTNVIIGASNDQTGNIKYGGN